MNKLASEQLKEEDFIPITYIDTEIRLDEVDLDAIEEMNRLSPYGMDNPKPKVLIKDASIANIRKIGSEQDHLKLALKQGEITLDGVGFG